MKTFSVHVCGSTAQGWCFLMFGLVSIMLFTYTVIVSKILPETDNPVVAAIQRDRFYCFLVPMSPLILFLAVYFHWLAMKLFKHA